MLAWGIIGTGDISERLVADLAALPGATVTAVWGRSAERAADFARSHPQIWAEDIGR